MASQKNKKKKQFSDLSHLHSKTLSLKSILLILGSILIILFVIYMAMPLFIFFGALSFQGFFDRSVFNNYEAFAKNVMPANFKLIETTEDHYAIDAPTQVVQRYLISSTRNTVLAELRPIFESRDYTINIVSFGGNLNDMQDFNSIKNQRQYYPTDINIAFIPNDCDTPPPGMPPGCVKYGWRDPRHTMHTTVKEVDISWEAR